MTTKEDVLQSVILGIPRVARRIVKLTEEQREKALAAVEQTYLQAAMDLDYVDADAREWVSAIMDCLRAEVDERIQHETQAMVDYDGFASLERTLRLLVGTAAADR